MKKNQVILIMGILFSVISTNVSAQLSKNDLPKNVGENVSAASHVNGVESKSTMKLNKASERALKQFNSSFKGEADVKWAVEKNGILSSFTKDDIHTSVIYDRSGRLIRIMKWYNEDKMPSEVRESIKRSVYFDYKIDLVRQFEEDGITFYIVYLKNGLQSKEVSFYDGEIKLLKSLTLAN